MAGRGVGEEEGGHDSDDMGRVFVRPSGEVKGDVAPTSVSEAREARSRGAGPKV